MTTKSYQDKLLTPDLSVICLTALPLIVLIFNLKK